MIESLTVFLWLTATAGHFLLTARFLRRTLPPDATLDEQAFATVLAGLGTLSVVLHLLAATTGLGLTSSLSVLVVAHGALWAVTRRAPIDSPVAGLSPGYRGIGEILAVVILTTFMLTWVDIASQSSAVVGTDAAHYHVPVAANLALGASLFDLPATPHLYPMAGSLLDAWFILPLGDPLIVDLAMCLPFLLLTVSINWIFRLSTGQSGLAWSSWVCVALFSTPLFRSSSRVSADLWFAAAFVAAAAVLLSMWARRTSWPTGMLLGGLAFGLLVGTKTTGTAAAALLLALYVLFELGRWLAVREAPPFGSWRGLTSVGGAAVLMLGAGGIWLVRNWYLFGSPIAPTGLTIAGVSIFSGEAFQPTTYLSVLGDLEKDATYDLPRRASRFIRIWIGEWFVPALGLIALVPVDGLLAWARGRHLQAVAVRLFLLLTALGVGGALVWLLAGAPWTSLEWTRGLSLRYALPVAALLPLVAFVGLFPVSWRWYEDEATSPIALAGVIVVAGFMFYSALDPRAARYVNVPMLSVVWLAVASVAVVGARWASARGLLAPVMALLCVGLAAAWTPMIVRRAERARDGVEARERRERANLLRSVRPDSAAREAYLLTLADEETAGRACERRRFFALTRVDEPLMFQSAIYANRVFYAGRDLQTTSRAAPLAACDYVITEPAVMDTVKGAALIAALANGSEVERIGAAGSFLVLRRR